MNLTDLHENKNAAIHSSVVFLSIRRSSLLSAFEFIFNVFVFNSNIPVRFL